MKWKTLISCLVLSAPINASIIEYETKGVELQGPTFTTTSLFQFCEADLRFTFDTVSGEVTDSSVSCQNSNLLLDSNGPSSIQFFDNGSPGESFWGINFFQQMTLSGTSERAESTWQFALVEASVYAEPSEMLANFDTIEGWPKYFSVIEYVSGELVVGATGAAAVENIYKVSVPEPATLSLLALGLAAIGIRRRLRYS